MKSVTFYRSFTRDGHKVSMVHCLNWVYSLRVGSIQVYVMPVILPSLLGAWCRMEQSSELLKISTETEESRTPFKVDM
jgi:L-cystine uptake protein TcyP (sodium:dicarboxylate symporter family)